MDERRLEAFVAVARELSFTRAAGRLHLSQSAVSQQVAALEQELGAPLFERNRRRVRLSPVGAVLLARAEGLLRETAELRRAVAAAQGEVAGALEVAASLTTAAYVLPRALTELRRRHPALVASLRVENTEEVAAALVAGRADVGFVEGEVAPAGIALEPVGVDELVVIAPPEHRFARAGELALHDLAVEPFVAREQGSGTRQVAEDALAAAGLDPAALRVVAELSGIDAIKAAVEAGLGVAIVSAATVEKELRLGTLAARRVAGVPMRRDFAAAFASGRVVLPAARELVALARVAAQALSSTRTRPASTRTG